MSQQLPPDVRHVLLLVALALTVLLCTLSRIEKWWQRSYFALAFRAYAQVVRQRLAYPFRLLRKRFSKATASAGSFQAPAPAVPHPDDDVEVSRDGDQ